MPKLFKIALIALSSLLLAIMAAAFGYIYNNLNYYKGPLQQIMAAGFKEKQVTVADGTVLNYAEGPHSGPPLLLIHGQTASWEDYAPVLPELSKDYHIFAVDCPGHGKSSKNPDEYSAVAIGTDLSWFIENVIGAPAVVSGHSSGGLLAAWIAANSPQDVRGLVLEDPPLFSTESSRIQKTYAWVDAFEPIHRFLSQSAEKDYTLWYLENSAWINYFGRGEAGIINYARYYRKAHPHERLEIFFLPPSINHTFYSMDSYDPRFGEAFYDGSWMKDFNHAETLTKINCPSVLIHTSWSYDENGVLLAAMDEDDAQRAHSLMKNNVLVDVASAHDFHFEHPQEFIKIMKGFRNRVQST
jgi:pimeloyl-ACP methyl ester carboxylesterase